jgi:putative transposase
MDSIVKPNWETIKSAASELGIDVSILPPLDDAPAVERPDKWDDPNIDVTDAEWVAMSHVLPADCGSDRRASISAALWLVSTGRPWTTLPQRLGSWGAQRRRFARWAHSGAWSRLADAIAAADVPDVRKQLYRRVASKAERQRRMLPEHRFRVTGVRG